MNNYEKKRVMILIILLSILILNIPTNIFKIKNKDELIVHFINVNHGDAILIQQGDHYMAIDGGKESDENTLRKYYSSLGIKKLDYVISTHCHEDHMGSLDFLIGKYEIGKLYVSNSKLQSKTYNNFMKVANKKHINLIVPNQGETFMLGKAICTIIAPKENEYKQVNDYSLIVRIEFKNKSFLFMADAETLTEDEIMGGNLNIKSDVIKIGHHGSGTSTSDKFLDAVSPKYAIISVGANYEIKHPRLKIMQRLQDRNIVVYRTDENGNVIATTDGYNIEFNCNPGDYRGYEDEFANKMTKANKSIYIYLHYVYLASCSRKIQIVFFICSILLIKYRINKSINERRV